jgi:zinc protease
MNRLSQSSLLLLLALVGCPKKEEPVVVAPAPAPAAEPAWRTQAPAPLSPRAFQIPPLSEAKLSNGISVVVVENHEVPIVYVRLVIEAGSFTDSPKKPGVAAFAMDMLNEGAGKLDAAALSRELRKLGSGVSSSAGLDGAAIGAQSLKDKLEPTLDLLALIALKPSFPAAELELKRKQTLQDLTSERNDPGRIADRVWRARMYGPQYEGVLQSEASVKQIKLADLKAWYAAYVRPENARIYVGGDTTLAEILPMLEARFGAWKGQGKAGPLQKPVAGSSIRPDKTTIYLADKPGAAQSVVSVGHPIPDRRAPDHTAFQLANRVIGGQFTSRINMNLREAKGWTYGSRSDSDYNYAGGMWSVSANIVTPHTAEAISEILRDLSQAHGERPITEAELEAARSSYLGGFPLGFENPGQLLGQTQDIRRYGLPETWTASFPDRVRAVTLADAQASWNGRVNVGQLAIVVVGDAALVAEPLTQLGFPVVRVDTDGQPVRP